MGKLIVWGLFDSGTSCYKQAVEKYFSDVMDIYSIGIDVNGKSSDRFINLNLADYSDIFSESEMFRVLDELPKPDIILASPPCESWSNAGNIPGGGNAYWCTAKINTVLGEFDSDHKYSIQRKAHLDKHNDTTTNIKKRIDKSIKVRVNGELCALNSMLIIERYLPNVWIIENPATSRIWNYFGDILEFKAYKNKTYYNAYDFEGFTQKPTVFYSNIVLHLKSEIIKSKYSWDGRDKTRPMVDMDYNVRSQIPLELIKDILQQAQEKMERES